MSFMEKPFEALVTSARTTGQTVLDKDGKLKMALHNLVPNTDLSDAGDWIYARLDSVVVSGTSPSGKPTYLVTEDSASGSHYLTENLSFTAGTAYSQVVDVKSNGRDTIKLGFSSDAFGADVRWTFDTTNLTVTQEVSGTHDRAYITLISDGYYRCVMTATATTTVASSSVLLFLTSGGALSYAGDGVSGAYCSRMRVYQSAVHAPPELVENGTFDTATTGFTEGENTTHSIVSAALRVTADANGAAFSSTVISCVVGETYAVTGDLVTDVTTGSMTLMVGTTAGNNDISSATIASGTGRYDITFVATQTTHHISLYLSAATLIGEYADFDNVSVAQIIGNGMQLATDGTDFLETTNGPVYHLGRGHDGNGVVLGSQHFEGRTNLATCSNDFTNAAWSNARMQSPVPNNVISPDGTGNGTALSPNTEFTTHHLNQAITWTAGASTFTLSMKYDNHQWVMIRIYDGLNFYYASFDMLNSVKGAVSAATTSKMTAKGNGWFDLSVTGVTLAATGTVLIYLNDADAITGQSWTPTGTEKVHVYGAQPEAGAFPTPYIPTQASPVARGADDASLLTSSFGYRAGEGAIVMTFSAADKISQRSVNLSDGTAANQIGQYMESGNLRYEVKAGSSTQVNVAGASGYTADTEYSYAMAYKENDFGISIDGTTTVIDSLGTVPAVNVLNLGAGAGGSNSLNGYIKSIAYYPTRFADAILESESA